MGKLVEEAMTSVKKTVISAVIAIFLSLGAYAIVNELMSVTSEEEEETAPSTAVTWHQELPY